MRTKLVSYSYPTSPNARRFKLGDGGYCVEYSTQREPIAGFNTFEQAWRYAETLPEQWDTFTLKPQPSPAKAETKSKPKHTPAPWNYIQSVIPGPVFTVLHCGDVVADLPPREDRVRDEALLQDARLIASAPDLLAACKAALERLEASQPPANGATEQVCKQVRAIITHAEGMEE